MLQFAIQSDAPPLPVVGQQRQQLVVFLQRRSGRHRISDIKEKTRVNVKIEQFSSPEQQRREENTKKQLILNNLKTN